MLLEAAAVAILCLVVDEWLPAVAGLHGYLHEGSEVFLVAAEFSPFKDLAFSSVRAP